MEWKTRLTEIFGCKYPILLGGLSNFGYAELAAAVSSAGAHGTITAGAYHSPEQLRQAIRRYHELSSEPFSVNISLTHCKDEEGMLKVVLEEDVPVLETAVYLSDSFGKRAHDAGRKWIHKVAAVKHAIHAQEAGADAIIMVGLEGIGKKNIEQLTTMTTLFWARKFVDVPLVISGGIGDGRGFLGALAMGADGIMMGTRFMATKECGLAERHKQNMIKMRPDNLYLKHRCLNTPDPKAYAELMKMREEGMPMHEWIPKATALFLKEDKWKSAAYKGPEDSGEDLEIMSNLWSEAIAVVDDIPTCKELIERIVREAEEMLDRFDWLKSWMEYKKQKVK
jgi:NAD(P)H-dependent flavin oxidoreductase YrpB (nitropropane dioxygenase family)